MSVCEEWIAGAVVQVEMRGAWMGVLEMERHHSFGEKAHGCVSLSLFPSMLRLWLILGLLLVSRENVPGFASLVAGGRGGRPGVLVWHLRSLLVWR